MAAAGGRQESDPARFIYVARFGSHQCGGVLQLGRRAGGRWSPRLEAGSSQEEPRGAAAAAGAWGGGEPFPGSDAGGPGGPAAASAAQPSSVRSSATSAAAARAGLIQKTLAKKFDFPIPFNEASKIMKKKKKVSVWKKVHKVICRMLEENEKYRLRLKCQQLSSQNSDYTG